ncbi:hypothetical protein H5410_042221 [Solanum commersonii]|uniref:Uncharacterized protein n=1 Tax=Solanum commersonii TaxID=4109 RepID=A0A9J5XTQ2_SOLCO|nr:hypothetical protein H5410_042221 [Solanum commersonii]
MGTHAHFKGQTSPEKANPHFLIIFMCYIVHRFLTLVVEPVGPDEQICPFARSIEPQSRQTPIFADFLVL